MQNIVSWGIQDKFAENPLTGFLEDAGNVIMTQKAKTSIKNITSEEATIKTGKDPEALMAEIFD